MGACRAPSCLAPWVGCPGSAPAGATAGTYAVKAARQATHNLSHPRLQAQRLSQQSTSLRCRAHGLLQQRARAITASTRSLQAVKLVSEQALHVEPRMLSRKGSQTVAMIRIEQKQAGTAQQMVGV